MKYEYEKKYLKYVLGAIINIHEIKGCKRILKRVLGAIIIAHLILPAFSFIVKMAAITISQSKHFTTKIQCRLLCHNCIILS